jgi:hypothetical protein
MAKILEGAPKLGFTLRHDERDFENLGVGFELLDRADAVGIE